MNQMSLPMFILVCLLPVPCLVIFHLTKAWKQFRIRYNVKNLSGIELNTMVNNKRPLELEDKEVTKEEISSVVGESRV